MATLISKATGNLTDASSWALVDSTSLLDSEAGLSTLSSSLVRQSSTFTPGAITIDGFALKLRGRSTVVDGTITGSLYNNAAAATVAGSDVTVNNADLPECSVGTNEGGWVFFKFASPITLLAATAYRVQILGSFSSATVTFWTDATSNNLSRMLRTTTTQAPVAGDVMHIMGEHTGAGTGNDLSVTMNQTATTDYGVGTDGVAAMTISKRGSLLWGTNAATNYFLKLSGMLIKYRGATYTIASTGTPFPSDSTADLVFDPVADWGMYFDDRSGDTVMQGPPRTSGKNVVKCRLTSTIVATNTTLNVDTDTGWLSGDEIHIAKTETGSTNTSEIRILSGNAGASSMGITVGVSNTHRGVAPYQGHVVLRTRNIVIRSATSSIMTGYRAGASAVVDLDWVQFRYVGGNNGSNYGIGINTGSTGSFSANYCSFCDSERTVLGIGTGATNVSITNSIFSNLNTGNPNAIYGILFSSGLGTITFTDNVIMGFGQAGGGANQNTINIADTDIDFSRNVITSAGLGHALVWGSNGIIGTFDDNEMYGCNGNGDTSALGGVITQTSPILSGTINRLVMWHNSSNNFTFSSSVANVTFNDCRFFGNGGNNIKFSPGGTAVNILFNNLQLNGDNLTATASGILIEAGSSIVKSTIKDSNLGIASGNYIAHTKDILVTGGYVDLLLENSNFGSATLVSGKSNLDGVSEIKFHKYNQTANDHRWYTKYGLAKSAGSGLTDTTVRTAGSLGVVIAAENASTGFTWEFNILAKANSIIPFFGFFRKNTAFSTDDVLIELFLPGSLVADTSYTLPDTYDQWLPVAISANYTGSVDLLATIKITCKTATSAAYLYIDDLYNAGTTNKIAGLDTWDEGKPVSFIVDTTFDPNSVWSYPTTNLTATGTTGKLLKDIGVNSDDAVVLGLT